VSLILEALRKLDRDKRAPERGFLVMAPAPWPASARARLPQLVLGLAIAMAVGGGLAYWLLRPAPQAAPAVAQAPVASTVPATTQPASLTLVSEPPVIPETLPRAMPAKPAPAVTTPATLPPPPSTAASAEKPPVPAVTGATAPVATAPAFERLAAPFVLQAISSRDGWPVAVINGRLVREGDLIDGVAILKIGVDTVELAVAGTHQVVHF